jgi:dihydroflavonol-4-reductase
MRLGITGATGFLGSHVVRRVAADGHHVVALRRPTSETTAVDGVPVEWIVGDVTDPGAVGRLAERSDVVVHAAAALANWQGARPEHERTNVVGAEVVAAGCRAAGVRRLVHVSSVAAVALPREPSPAAEDARLELPPGLSYHESKRRAEDRVRREVERGLDAVIVNPASLQGPHHTGFRGARLIDGVRNRRFVPHFRGGTNIVHVDDVVSGILLALEHGRAGERYIVAGENHTWRELAEIAAAELSLSRVFLPLPGAATAAAALLGEANGRRTGRTPHFTRDVHVASSRYLYYDSGKAERELNYRFRPYREIVREYLRSSGGGSE